MNLHEMLGRKEEELDAARQDAELVRRQFIGAMQLLEELKSGEKSLDNVELFNDGAHTGWHYSEPASNGEAVEAG